MGLIAAAGASVSSILGDQWKEYFYCESLPNTVLATKGRKRSTLRGGNHGLDNIITSGSIIAVADGQCMLIVEQGKIVDVCAEPGEYQYDASTEPSVFSGKDKRRFQKKLIQRRPFREGNRRQARFHHWLRSNVIDYLILRIIQILLIVIRTI